MNTIKLTSSHNGAAMIFNQDKIALIIDNTIDAQNGEGQPKTFVFVDGQASAFGVNEEFGAVEMFLLGGLVSV